MEPAPEPKAAKRPCSAPAGQMDIPVAERRETSAHGRGPSRDLCLARCDALAAGQPDAEPDAAWFTVTLEPRPLRGRGPGRSGSGSAARG